MVLKTPFFLQSIGPNLLVGVVLGDGLGSLGHGVLGQLTGEHQTDGGLDLAGRDGVALVVASQTSTLGGNALEQVVHKGVHDDHGLLGNTSVRVHLLEHLVDVRGVRVGVGLALAGLLVVSALSLGRGLASLAGCLSRCCLCLKNKTFFQNFFCFFFGRQKNFRLI